MKNKQPTTVFASLFAYHHFLIPMRSRQPPSGGVEDHADVAASTVLGSSASSSPAAAAASLLQDEVLPRLRKESGPSNAAICDAYATRLRQEATEEERRRGPHWRARCSPSILVALLIWATIALVVYMKVDNSRLRPGAAPDTTSVETPLSQLPESCRGHYCLREGGKEPFGAVLGAHDGVFAYSNCNSDTCTSLLKYQMAIPLPPGARTALDAPHATTRLMTTGMKWQCVEFARRYWMLRGKPTPAFFGPVVGAADIWDTLTHVTFLDNATTAPLLKFKNGARLGYGGSAPRVGDLLIYPRDAEGFFSYGHVAVVVRVEMTTKAETDDSHMDAAVTSSKPRQRHGLVYLAEQNWDSATWPNPYHNYSRSLPLVVLESAEGLPLQYTIQDSLHGIQGWVRYDDEP
ncbi:DAL2 / cysteine peptidase - Clan CA - family C51 [Leishmania donovani]|uniref:Cysteine_peptidase_Clan_CA_family_C51_putative/Ge neDB:LmjF.33.2850 n=2 Tax=Leishmania donovani TaxID=5661 RepID=A0A6J8FK95_LEIDO|nr:DAL2 / cysteine peptidase - Clan CA - family C51 [Leishmania donovani]VDZ48123.1 cysteine_peptidase_Clan_CA_family_C51_putative/GeneDB:LmjF.33.2850 [Leishmania donovani]